MSDVAVRLPANHLDHIRRDVEALPPLPETALRVMRMTRDPDVSADQLTKVITQDQSLTANVLRLCNSAHYGLPRVISSVSQGVMYLGFCAVRTLVLTSSMRSYFSRPLDVYGYEGDGLWRHCVATALAAQTLCRRQRPDIDDVAYTAGLLHDIGKVVLVQYLAPHIEQVRRMVVEERVAFTEAERCILGTDHAELGGDIAALWNFPEHLVDAIRMHHALDGQGDANYLGCVVHVADATALAVGLGTGDDGLHQQLDGSALSALGLDADGYDAYCNHVMEAIESAGEFLT